jgi:hypothetical protein
MWITGQEFVITVHFLLFPQAEDLPPEQIEGKGYSRTFTGTTEVYFK